MGPACVYKVNFGDRPEEEIRDLVSAYRAQGSPDAWFVTPLSTPSNVRDLLTDLGLMNPEIADMSDQGMAIPTVQKANRVWKSMGDKYQAHTKKVSNREDFKIWCDISNGVLSGFQMLDPDLYYPVCETGKMVCFLGYCGDLPVAASGTMNNKGNGTLEFTATLPDYRKKGVGTAVCRVALDQLADDGAYLISLRARAMGASLYQSLGFKVYFGF